MKVTISALALAAALCAFGEETAAPAKAPAPAEAPAPAVQSNAAAARDTVDVIDLEEADDSAEARANAPVVTAAAQEGGATLVDIACDNATLEDVLRQFRKVTDANIISDDSTNLQRRVSVNLHRVPWLDGLQSILNSRNYRLEERGSIFFVKEDKVAEPILTRSFTLNHASAKELADLFNKSYGKKDQRGLLIMPIATSFDGANVVVVTATEKTIGECESIIKAVDKAVAQIYIEARFLELSSQAMHKLGIQWNQLESWGASIRNLSGGMEYNQGHAANYGTGLRERGETTSKTGESSSSSSTAGSNSSTTSGSSSSPSALDPSVINTSTTLSKSDSQTSSSSQSLTSPTVGSSSSSSYTGLFPKEIGAAVGAGRDAASMAWRNARGFGGQFSADDFRLALSAFESFGEGKMFSNPKIIVSNGKEAKVDMTTKYPNVTINANYLGEYQQNLAISTKLDAIPGEDKFMFAKEAFFSWGIELSVTPRISPDGLISVVIVPTISDCSGYVNVNAKETDIPYTQYPIIEIKRLITEFTMKDGATAVIGGLSRTSEDDVDSGIPYLRELPWIGQKLFGWKSRQKVQKEIIVCVTIGIANPAELPKDMGLPTNAILGREYVEGRRLEPGDRKGAAHEALKLDFRTLDEQRKDESAPGTVTIKPAD